MRLLVILAILCLIFPCHLLAQIAPAQPGGAIPVSICNYAECPTIDEDRLKSILKLAQQAISDACLTDVSFHITLHEDARVFLAAQKAKYAPYQPDLSLDPFKVTPDDYNRLYRSTLEAEYSPREISAYEKRFSLTSDDGYAALANLLTHRRVASWQPLTELKQVNGSPLLTPLSWHDFDVINWGAAVEADDWSAPLRLYITNGLILDTSAEPEMGEETDQSLYANALATMSSNSAIVSYYAILSPSLHAGNPHFSHMTDDDQNRALAYVIAQSIGPRLLLHQGADSRPDAGLNRPVYSLSTIDDLKDMNGWQLNFLTPDTPELQYSQFEKAETRIRIFAAKKDANGIAAELKHATSLDLPVDDMNSLAKLAEQLDASK